MGTIMTLRQACIVLLVLIAVNLLPITASAAQLRAVTVSESPPETLVVPTNSINSSLSSTNRKKIVIVSDVATELSGVNTCLNNTKRILEQWGHEVLYMTPTTLNLLTVPLYGIDKGFPVFIPTPLNAYKISRILDQFQPDHVHISTEATLGSLVRGMCIRRNWKFSTAFHTNVPEVSMETVVRV